MTQVSCFHQFAYLPWSFCFQLLFIGDICVGDKFSVIFYPYINRHLNFVSMSRKSKKKKKKSIEIILVVTVKFVAVVNISSDLSTLSYVNNNDV